MEDLQSRAERVRCLGTIINVHFLVMPLSRPGEEWAGGCRAIGAPLAAGDIFFQKDYLRVSGLAYCVRELAIHFYPNNQYHRWLFGDGNWLTGKGSTFSKGLLRGDLGMSYTTKMAVSETIRNRIGWSFFFTLISVILGYLVSIPIGIRSATRKGSAFDQASSVILFILYVFIQDVTQKKHGVLRRA